MLNEKNQKQGHQVSAQDFQLLKEIKNKQLVTITAEQHDEYLLLKDPSLNPSPEDEALLEWFHEFELVLSREAAEAMANLQFYDPNKVAYLFSYLLCEAFTHLPEDHFNFKLKDLVPLVKLQEFLFTWGTAYTSVQIQYEQRQAETAMAEEG